MWLACDVASGIGMSEVLGGAGVSFSGTAAMRAAHMMCVYASLVLLPFHFGMHARMLVGAARFRQALRDASKPVFAVVVVALAAVCAYGAYAFAKVNLWEYISGATQFAFMDTTVALPVFLADYAAVMVLAACAGFVLDSALRKFGKRRAE